MPKPFNLFASGIVFLTETDQSFESVVTMLYYSMDLKGRIEFLEFISDLLKPPIDPAEVDRIWIKSGGSIGFETPQNTVGFLRQVLEICEAYQKRIDLNKTRYRL